MPATAYARFAAGIRLAALRPEVFHDARLGLVDGYAASLPRSVQAPATLLREALDDERGRGTPALVRAASRA